MDHGNEFRWSKNSGREVWVGLKWPENIKIRPPTVAAASFAGPIWASGCGGGAPPWPASVARGWLESPPTAKTRLA